ncbi:MAG: ATP-binding cassette domain-containing protein [Rhodospirillales bacterium]
MSGTPKIEIRELNKAFGRKRVLRGVNLAVAPGESVAIIGGSGSGKSVTLKCLLGLLDADSGDISIDGQSILEARGRERQALMSRIGVLFQGAALFDSLTVWENVAFGLISERGMSRHDAREVAIEKMALAGLESALADRSPAELSGGMQKRAGLARAIATEPEIVLFDEPTTGLDPLMGDVINDLIADCVVDLGITALTITHDMRSACAIADRIAMLHEGVIAWAGPVSDIRQSGNPVVDQFVSGRTDGPIQVAGRA